MEKEKCLDQKPKTIVFSNAWTIVAKIPSNVLLQSNLILLQVVGNVRKRHGVYVTSRKYF